MSPYFKKVKSEKILFNFGHFFFPNIDGLTPLLSWLQCTNFPVCPHSFNVTRNNEPSQGEQNRAAGGGTERVQLVWATPAGPLALGQLGR